MRLPNSVIPRAAVLLGVSMLIPTVVLATNASSTAKTTTGAAAPRPRSHRR